MTVFWISLLIAAGALQLSIGIATLCLIDRLTGEVNFTSRVMVDILQTVIRIGDGKRGAGTSPTPGSLK